MFYASAVNCARGAMIYFAKASEKARAAVRMHERIRECSFVLCVSECAVFACAYACPQIIVSACLYMRVIVRKCVAFHV